MKPALIGGILALAAAPSFAHRLDQYLQGTIVSIGKTRFEAQMTMTPGVAVLPQLMADIDTDGNGVISEAEQRAYAKRVVQDLSLTIDGKSLAPELTSIQFAAMNEMKEGRGEIQLNFAAGLPRGARNRKLTLENHHETRIAAYQVNSLVPADPDIRITAQTRNYTQSLYELDYEQADIPAPSQSVWSARTIWLSSAALLPLAWLAIRWRPRARSK